MHPLLSVAAHFCCLLCLLMVICQLMNQGVSLHTYLTAFTVIFVQSACGNTFWPTALFGILIVRHWGLFLSWTRNSSRLRPRKVLAIDDIKPGDRVAFSWFLYEHHAIVEYVLPEEASFIVISVGLKLHTNIMDGFMHGIIRSRGCKFSKLWSLLYVIEYEEGQCLADSVVVDNALGMVGRVKYNPLTKNSKYYANLMKTQRNQAQPVEASVNRSTIQVTAIDRLRPGDHIAFARPLPYKHHGIVISVHPNEDIFNVVEVNGNVTKDEVTGKTMADIRNKPHVFSKDNVVFVVEYNEQECQPASKVIRDATRLDGESVEYNLFTKNCEHYASEIKTGIGVSEQIEDLARQTNVVRSVLLVAQDVLRDVYKFVLRADTVGPVP